ncbi:MAG: histidine kinase [Phaeodactylibacter sp.]|nr:histidine kinase [Phaeodactylibacter sp.]MCB9266809.1 histidine kinase [Lewinellaceae bacterium]MCB9287909.1 histidine kinase [Lewinellaceae bacterium]
MRRLASLLFALSWWLCTTAQKDLHFEQFTTRDGLSHNEVRSLLSDSRGYLWIGTANGLNRFDGYEFRPFLPDPGQPGGISGEVVVALAEGPHGRIWVVHNRGIDIYNPSTGDFLRVPPRQEDAGNWAFTSSTSIFIGSKGHVVITRDGPRMLWFPPDGFDYEWLDAPDVPLAQRPVNYRNAPENGFTAVSRKGPDEVWASSLLGLFSFNLPEKRLAYHSLEDCHLQYGPGAVCADDKRQVIWFTGFGQDLFSLNPHTGECNGWGLIPGKFIDGSTEVALLKGGGVWMSQPAVLYPETGQVLLVHHTPDDPYSFPDASPSAVATNQDGILWVGTSGGLVKLDPYLQGFRHVVLEGHPRYDYDNSVFDIFENPDDGLFYITSFYTNLIFVFDPATGISRDITSEFRPSIQGFPTRIFRDSYGLTWLLEGGGLFQADLGRRRLRPVEMPPLPSEAIGRATFDIAEDTRGDLWITKWRAGLLHYRRQNGKFEFVTPPEGMPAPRSAYCVAASPGGAAIWLGTVSEGLFRVETASGKWTQFTEFPSGGGPVSLMEITGLEFDEESNLWIACRQGLVRYDSQGQARLFTKADGLANSLLEGMAMDKKGRLWLATGSGISSMDPGTFTIRNYDERHGLKIDATLDGFSVGLNGELFAGTKRGFVRFHPDSLPVDERPPRLALTAFTVGGAEYKKEGRLVDFGDELRLKPSENFFSIQYAALNFTLPEENTYYYKLEGLDESWIEAGRRRTANYTKVPPGQYRFCLKARNKDGIWSSDVKVLGIFVAPPFWRKPWFIVLFITSIAGMGYGAYRFRINQVRKEAQMKAEFNKKLAEVEMAALRSQMNPHFLFNCLNSINRFIQRNEPDAASAYLTKFARLIRLVLDNSRSDLVSLRDELEALRLYIELEAMRFVGRFSYSIEIASELDTSSIEVPPMLVQPYVENAIWHGLMHKESDDCRLWVKAYPEHGRLAIIVEDNGIGREMARRLKSKSATLHKSHGMKVTAERIEVINEIFQAKAAVRIEDLRDEIGSAAGTRVSIFLPME